ncbi:hypothetical protein N7492_009276 [Penicillium capsulatum]|uniref:Uncharacterized protein n=1 Tax=Penicillium capsulatum TaxID=69766 RepID=A0A9W9HRC7_9EURO|nr:hypothetical protein N7492_009276 [Penicillium capsulatum]KAJ6106670.1 hypothetical protein N7512_010187 [Penicillium capsulatum]
MAPLLSGVDLDLLAREVKDIYGKTITAINSFTEHTRQNSIVNTPKRRRVAMAAKMYLDLESIGQGASQAYIHFPKGLDNLLKAKEVYEQATEALMSNRIRVDCYGTVWRWEDPLPDDDGCEPGYWRNTWANKRHSESARRIQEKGVPDKADNACDYKGVLGFTTFPMYVSMCRALRKEYATLYDAKAAIRKSKPGTALDYFFTPSKTLAHEVIHIARKDFTDERIIIGGVERGAYNTIGAISATVQGKALTNVDNYAIFALTVYLSDEFNFANGEKVEGNAVSPSKWWVPP